MNSSSVQQPMIVKYVESLHNGIRTQVLSRYAIGYILRGTKYIYDGDKRQTLTRGDVFYLGIGHHYIENCPEGGQPFEQVLFYYTPEDLQRILMHLNITYGLNIAVASTYSWELGYGIGDWDAYRVRKATGIRSPSTTLLIGETGIYNDYIYPPAKNDKIIKMTHGDRWQMLMTDGHADSIHYAAIPTKLGFWTIDVGD